MSLFFVAGCKIIEPNNSNSFLSTSDVREINITKDWESFSKNDNVSVSSQIGYYQMIINKDLEVVDIRWRIVDKVDGGYVEHIYRKGKFSNPPKEYVTLEYDGPPSSISGEGNNDIAKDFFDKVKIILENHSIFTDEGYNYYVIKATGKKANVGIRGDYYRLYQDTVEKVTQGNSFDDVYFIQVSSMNDVQQGSGFNRKIFIYK